jgi:hypothetical protein
MTGYARDPSEPRRHVDGLGQIACTISTHYPSSVRADEGGKAALGAALCFNSDSRLGDLGART